MWFLLEKLEEKAHTLLQCFSGLQFAWELIVTNKNKQNNNKIITIIQSKKEGGKNAIQLLELFFVLFSVLE